MISKHLGTRCMALFLALVTLAVSLCACGDTGESGASGTQPSASGTAGDNASESEGDTTPVCELPELNFGDEEIVILSRYREGWTSGEIAVEGIKNEPVNDAVYERNKIVEDQLKVKIVSIEDHSEQPEIVLNKLSTSIGGGTHEYDIFAAACFVALNASLEGNFRDLRKTEYLDFDKPWWSQGFNDSTEYKGMQFCVTGAAVLSMYRFAFATLFNKKLFSEAKVPFLYDNVRDGSWTLDYQNSIVEIFYRDDGNGKQDETGDIYGFVSNDYIGVDPYWSSCKVPILQRDENGEYTLSGFDAGKLQSVAEKVVQLFYGHGNASYDYKHYGNDAEQDDIRDMFAGGYAAMATLRIMSLESGVMRDMKDEYGVVPMPKFNEAQEDYGTFLHDQFTVLSIPKTALDDRRDIVSAVMESLGYNSYNVVRPAYYDVALRAKLVTDPDSAEMLDLLFNKVNIDAGIIYTSAMSSFHDEFRQLMGSKKSNIMSQYKRKAKRSETALRRNIVEALQKLYDSGNA